MTSNLLRPKLTSEYYQRTSRRYIILPFVVLFLLLLASFSFYDLVKTVRKDIKDTQMSNQILAKTAAMRQTSLLTQQIDGLVSSCPMIKSVIFYPIVIPQSHVIQEQGIKNILFDDTLGVSEPIFLDNNLNTAIDDTNQNLIGYIHTTLDLNHIRKRWLMSALPMYGVIVILATTILIVALIMVKRVTNRLPLLERLSQASLKVDIDTDSTSQIDTLIDNVSQHSLTNDHNSQRWIFEKALLHLLSQIRVQHYRFITLEKELKITRQDALDQTLERTKIQNMLLLEVKMALKRIQAGLQLLANHYVSQEQQDAVSIIEQGADELNQKMDQIIQFQRMERGQIGIEQQLFDPDELVNGLIEKYTKIAQKKNLRIDFKSHYAKYALEGDIQKITTILASFIENALQYTEQGQITVISRIYHLEDSLRWEVAVNDTGIGIEKSQFAAIFDPFFQVNPDAYDEISLLGVDLSLVKKLASMVGAEVQVQSEIGVGSSFSVTFHVNDWTQHFDRTLLKDKSFALLSLQENYQLLRKKFQVAGATVEHFNDIQLLMNYLTLHQKDALLIAPDYDSEQVTALVSAIRASEQTHRMTIIYYYLEESLPNFDDLRAAGVDYFEAFYTEDNNQDYYVKSMVKFLS